MMESYQNETICLHCGGEYEYQSGRWKCKYCGSTKPEELSNEETTLVYTAFKTLRKSEFEEAEAEFDDLIHKYPKNPYGYWGRLLSKYCIKYEDDYYGKKIPTCYATALENMSLSSDYKKALQYADAETEKYFQTQVAYMESVRNEWLENASKEKPYDIFICYKDSDLEQGISRTQDSYVAQDLYTHFTDKGYRVFYSHVSLREKAGEKYEPYIFHALSTAKVMLVYGQNADYINSTWLKNEWTRYRKLIQIGQKDPHSLIVAYEGFSPSDLPGVLKATQCLDASEKSFYQTLDSKISAIIQHEKEFEESSYFNHPIQTENKTYYNEANASVSATKPKAENKVSLAFLENAGNSFGHQVPNSSIKETASVRFIRFLLTFCLGWIGSFIINHTSLKPEGYTSKTWSYAILGYITCGFYNLIASINNFFFDPNKEKNIGYSQN